MKRTRSMILLASSLMAANLVASAGRSQEAATDVQLPDAVDETFKAAYPNAEIQKLTAEVENGITVYDFEFKDGETEKETDIAADGTMLEWTLVVAAGDIPAGPMKTISAHAKGATLGRLERIEVRYDTRDGKVVELPTLVIRYAAEMTKGKKKAEVIVNSDGTVFEKPEWAPIEPKPEAKSAKESLRR